MRPPLFKGSLPLRPPPRFYHRPQTPEARGPRLREKKLIGVAQHRRTSLKPLDHQAGVEPVFGKIEIQVRQRLDCAGKVGNLSSMDQAVPNLVRVDHKTVGVDVRGTDKMANTHGEPHTR